MQRRRLSLKTHLRHSSMNWRVAGVCIVAIGALVLLVQGGLRFFYPISREQTLKNDGVSVSLSNKKEHLTPDLCGSDPTSPVLSPISRSSISNDGLTVDFYYQFPDWGDQLLGAYMLFHGCTHAGDHWFTYPEERIISRCLLNKGYAVFAFTSQDRRSGCWDQSESLDILDVFCQEMPLLNLEISFCTRRDQYSKGKSSQGHGQPKIPSEQSSRMDKIRTRYQSKVPKSLPVYAIGGSSGGVFASHISLEYPDFAGISVIVSSGSHGAESVSKVPTMFVSMSRDDLLHEKITSELVPTFRSRSVPVAIRVIEPRLMPWFYFYQWIEKVTKDESEAIFMALEEGRYIDPQKWDRSLNYLAEDPRMSGIHDYLLEASSPAFRETIRQAYEHSGQHIIEEFNVAWAKHELTSEFIGDVVDWLANPKSQS